jgi:UDP-glucuronate 4-epimerase
MGSGNLITAPVLVTGAAGFIGFHFSEMLLKEGLRVIGFDNLNDYYDPTLKQSRLDVLKQYDTFEFIKGDLSDNEAVVGVFNRYSPKIVVHLAAQAGVRYSFENPCTYIDSNIVGFLNILEACRHNDTEHLLYASSSSVYGNLEKTPFAVGDDVNTPISLYAATKMSNELMAHTYSHIFGIPATGLRFFTVYGPYGRPDMAYFKFADKIFKDETIQVFNHGDLYRDFTYIDDITHAMRRMLNHPPKVGATAGTQAQYKVYNIGGGNPEHLMHFIETLENALGKKAKKEFLPMQPGDVYKTFADTTDLEKDFDFAPRVRIDEGLLRFAEWYKWYYHR